MFQLSSPAKLLIATVFAGVLSATVANANTITITPQDDASNHNLVVISTADPADTIVGLLCPGGPTAECSSSGTAAVGSLTAATGFAPFSGNPAEEATELEAIIGGDFTAGQKHDFSATSYTIDTPIFTIKQDGWIAFFAWFNFTPGDTLIVNL